MHQPEFADPHIRSDDAASLLDAAFRTFAKYGWRDSAVDTLCRTTGIPSATFYALYETVDDLFLDLYRREAVARVGATRSALEPITRGLTGSTPDKAMTAVVDALGVVANDRDWWIITTEYTLRAVRHPDVAGRYRRLRRQTQLEMAEVVREALDACDLAGHVDVEQFVELTTAVHRGAMGHSLLDPDSSPPGALDKVVWSAVLQQRT